MDRPFQQGWERLQVKLLGNVDVEAHWKPDENQPGLNPDPSLISLCFYKTTPGRNTTDRPRWPSFHVVGMTVRAGTQCLSFTFASCHPAMKYGGKKMVWGGGTHDSSYLPETPSQSQSLGMKCNGSPTSPPLKRLFPKQLFQI